MKALFRSKREKALEAKVEWLTNEVELLRRLMEYQITINRGALETDHIQNDVINGNVRAIDSLTADLEKFQDLVCKAIANSRR